VQPSNDEDFLFGGDDVEPFSGDMLILNTMLIMKNIFLKYNTVLPSSASVKHLYSVADDI